MNWYMDGSTCIFSVLAGVSLVTILAGRPWTIMVARRKTPPEVWSTGLFLETNMIITGAWAILFALAAYMSPAMNLWAGLLLGAVFVILGRLSSRFGLWYSSKRLKSLPGNKP
jgi:hypothetical protein